MIIIIFISGCILSLTCSFPLFCFFCWPLQLLEAVQSSSYLDVLMPSHTSEVAAVAAVAATAAATTAGVVNMVDMDDAYLMGGEYSGKSDNDQQHVSEEPQQQKMWMLLVKVRCVDNPTMWVMV